MSTPRGRGVSRGSVNPPRTPSTHNSANEKQHPVFNQARGHSNTNAGRGRGQGRGRGRGCVNENTSTPPSNPKQDWSEIVKRTPSTNSTSLNAQQPPNNNKPREQQNQPNVNKPQQSRGNVTQDKKLPGLSSAPAKQSFRRQSEPVTIAHLIDKAIKQKTAPQPKAPPKKPPKSLPSRRDDEEVIELASGEVVRKHRKERVEVAPKRLSTLKEVISKERLEQFLDIKQSAEDEAMKEIDDRIQAYQERLLKRGIKLRIRTDRQKELARLANVPRIPQKMKYREYCRQIITEELDNAVKELLSQLTVFQMRLKEMKNVAKAKKNRRYKIGIKESRRAVQVGKAKVVIIAPNIEEIKSPSGLNDQISALIQEAREQRIPVVFALSKKRLGECINKRKLQVTVIAVISVEGAHELYKALLRQYEKHRLLSALQYKVQQQLLKETFGISVRRFALVTRRNELVLDEIVDGSTLNIAAYRPSGTDKSVMPVLFIKICTTPHQVGSVFTQVWYNDTELPSKLLNGTPYIVRAALPNSAIFTPVRLVPGTYKISATPYSEFDGRGEAGDTRSISFVVIDEPLTEEQRMELLGVDVHDEEDDEQELAIAEQPATDKQDSDDSSESDESSLEDSTEVTGVSTADSNNDKTNSLQAQELAHKPIDNEQNMQQRSMNPEIAEKKLIVPTSPAVDLTTPIVPPPKSLLNKERKFLLKQQQAAIYITNDEEEMQLKMLREKHRKQFLLPKDDEEGPIDWMSLDLTTLLARTEVSRLLDDYYVQTSQASNQPRTENQSAILFLRIPNQYRMIVHYCPDLSISVLQLKSIISSMFEDRPVRKMKLALLNQELHDDQVLAHIPNLRNFSTLLLLRKNDNIEQILDDE